MARHAKKSYSVFGIFVLFTILLMLPTNVISVNPLSFLSNTASAATSGSIVLNNVKTTSGTVSSSPFQLTLSNFNAGTGTNRLLVVGVDANNNGVVSITYGGVPLTNKVSTFSNNDAEFWYLTNPSGTGNIVVTMAGATSVVVGAYAFSGVDQTTPIPTSTANHNTAASSPTISITTQNPNSWVLDLPAIYGGSTLGSSTCTQQWDTNMPNAITGASSSASPASAGSVTCSWTASSGDLWDDAAIEVKASGTGTTTAPGSPTGLTATAASSSQINLSWTAPSSNGGSAITGYKIERSTDGGTTWSTIVSNTSSTGTTYSDTGLASSTTYTYRVSAINSVGTSSPSNTASATTNSGSTSGSIVLNNVKTTSGTVSSAPYQITLSNFNAGTGSNQLLVVGISANNNNIVLVTFGGMPLTKKVSTFSNNDAEFWYLTNPSGTGNIVVTMTGTTSAVVGAYAFSGVDQTTPIPTSTANHNTAASSPTISITTQNSNSWVLDLPAIYGGTTLGSPTCTQQWDANIPNAITGASSSASSSSAGSVTCSWTASSGDMWDDAAIEVKASGTGTATAPGSPTGLTATATSSSQINLSWTAPTSNGGSAITGYKIERSTDGGTTWSTTVANTASTGTTYSDTGLASSTTYTYRVSAINSVGTSTPSNTASATTSGTVSSVPQPPTGLTSTTASSSQINLAWTAPSNNGGSTITGYKIERSTDSGTTWSTIVSNTSSTSTTYSDSGLAASTAYTYRVSAINSVGTGSPSNTASATTSQVSTVRAISLSTSSVNVGTDVRVTGTKFAPNSQITMSYDGTALGVGSQDNGYSTVPLTITTDSSGNFVAIMPTLVSVIGTHTISAKDASANTASQSLTVSPHAYLFPTTGHAGSSVLIPASQGNGFVASSAITIKFDGTTITPSAGITSDTSGSFGGNFTIPSGAAPGPHTIVISDARGNSFSASYTVDPTAHAFSAQSVITGLNFPAYFAFIPDNGPGADGSGAFMVNEKNTGNVIVFKNVNGQFVKQTVSFVTVPNLQTNYETNGLLGIAFDPKWATSSASQYVYFYVTRTVSNSVVGELIRYHATTDSSGNIVEDKSVGEQLVLGSIPAFKNGHNGGTLKFDSQGNLYISTGDGWTFTAGQDLTTLQGKILHITPLASPVNGKLYSIPSTNPFASSTNTSIKKEIWGYGVRNPYTFDIDSQTGKLYASDVGFNTWERIEDFTAGGNNAGWSNYERPPVGNPQNVASYVPPLYWYAHQGVEPQTGPSAGLEALSAGAFYHGTTYPNLQGAYFFGDYGVGNIAALLPSSVAPPTTDPASGYPIGQTMPILYGLTQAPIYMQEWNGKIYFMDLSGHINVLNYN